ncbi:MAG: FAD-binding oxidoreductase [Thermoanaerobaculia bacterium]|nr:FAD-binding oxidoreductase [Thermoanaerobaculia bacterium]
MVDHAGVAESAGTADVAIIGAGVVGCSVAFHLARLGCTNVLLIDKEPLPGSGSTSKANGGIRAQFTTDVNIAMSLASMDILDTLRDEIGDPPLYRKAGYLFLTGDPARFSAMTAAAAFQRARGVSVEVLDAAGVRAKAPYAAGPIAGGTFGPRDGFIDPGGLTNFLLREAARSGVRTRYGAEVTAIDRGGGTFRLTTTAGELRASVVVDAAGPFAGRVAALAGADVPVVPVRRHLLISGPCPALPPVIPMTIDADTGVLIRREGSRVLIAWSNPDEPPGFNTAFDPDFPLRIAAPVDARFPAVGEAGLDIKRSWAGLYEVTPDHHAVLGPVAAVPGFLVVAGFSGHGIMHAPAAGRAAAEMLVRGRSESLDVSALSLERFARGEAIHETMVL